MLSYQHNCRGSGKTGNVGSRAAPRASLIIFICLLIPMSALRRGTRRRRRAPGSPVSRIASLMRALRRRTYRSPAEYYGKVSLAAAAFGNAASALAELESAFSPKPPQPPLPMARTLEVSPTGDPAEDFRKIQAAVDNAAPGDRILLKQGVFASAGVVWLPKDIVIEGEPGAIIEGATHHGGKVIADPAANGGFVVSGGSSAEIRNVHFRRLYFAVASHSGFGRLVLEDNVFEDVYHSVYLSAVRGGEEAALVARCNRLFITSLNASSSRCRLNFYDESHLFGFYCAGKMGVVLEGNHLEVRELTGSSPFHAVAIACSESSAAAVRDNFIKGWHAPITVHHVLSPVIHRNEIHGLCEEPEHKPVAIFLRGCQDPLVCSNRITSRGLGAGAVGITASETRKGRIFGNMIRLGRGAGGGILVCRSNGLLIGQNEVGGGLACPIGLFGDQSEDVRGNLVFSNSLDGNAEIKMCYASENTVIGPRAARSQDQQRNALVGYSVEAGEALSGMASSHYLRHKRVHEHEGRKIWPRVPGRYSQGGHDENDKKDY